jgi:hypothetical protein
MKIVLEKKNLRIHGMKYEKGNDNLELDITMDDQRFIVVVDSESFEILSKSFLKKLGDITTN